MTRTTAFRRKPPFLHSPRRSRSPATVTKRQILIAPGEYPQAAAIRVEAPISIRGTGAAATNVVLRNTTSGQHVITLAHADAELALVTLTGGSAGSGPACLGIEAGLVRDCWVTGTSFSLGKQITGGTVLMSGGRLMRSVIRDNTMMGTGWNSVFSAGVYATAGVVENCLIAGNSQRAYNDKGGGKPDVRADVFGKELWLPSEQEL